VEVANYLQKELAGKLGYERGSITRKEKYGMVSRTDDCVPSEDNKLGKDNGIISG
jgi:glycerol-3-phosphate acyltransferase